MILRCVLALCVVAFASSTGAVTLEQAVASGDVSADITALNSYRSARITVANRTDHAMLVTALPGVVFENEDADEQDVTLSQPLSLSIAPGKSVTRLVGTYCVRPHDQPPRTGVAYHTRGFDRELARYLRDHYAARPDSAVQEQVWRMLDARNDGASGEPIER